MTGNFYINGYNASNSFGVIMLEGSAENLVKFPPLEEPPTNEWDDEDGIEVDLNEPALKPREITLSFATNRKTANVPAFLNHIIQTSINTIQVTELGITRKLRYQSCARLEGEPSRVRWFDVSFIEDKPMAEYTYTEPATTLNRTESYNLGIEGTSISKPLKDYNFIALRGTDEELERAYNIKPALTTKHANISGQEYDYYAPKKKAARRAAIKGLIITESPSDFNAKIDALLYDLIRPGERALIRIKDGAVFKFFYQDCYVRKVSSYRGDGVWCEIEIGITLTNAE